MARSARVADVGVSGGQPGSSAVVGRSLSR
jgi:hypothetical protein